MIIEDVKFGNLYLGNKMTNLPYFNAPWFDATANRLRLLSGVALVFNPADEDRRRGFEPMSVPDGNIEAARKAGFVARDALGADWSWIATWSNGLVAGPEWHTSTGTISEIACHQALGLPVWEDEVFFEAFERNDAYSLLNTKYQLPSLSALIGC